MSDATFITRRTMERIEQLALITDEPGILCRTFLSPAMARANETVAGWMEEAGCGVTIDSWGNLMGEVKSAKPGARTLLLGSHLDTVRNAGKFDGMLGVLVALASVEMLRAEGIRLPFHLELLGFSDEEGTRFHSTYLGSKAFLGLIETSDLTLQDEGGVSLGEVVAEYQDREEPTLPPPRHAAQELLGYVEVHLEQGPVLEERGMALGVVDHIAAQTRLSCQVEGKAGHAGTTPMTLRRDALAAAADSVLAVERIGVAMPKLVATVGQLTVSPNVSNVIPAVVRFSVDIRHSEMAMVDQAVGEISRAFEQIQRQRGTPVHMSTVQRNAGVACDPGLVRKLEDAVLHQQKTAVHLVSGAGHDGIMLSRVTPIAMLFVRCRDGLSHHPDEYVAEADVAAAIQALTRFLKDFS